MALYSTFASSAENCLVSDRLQTTETPATKDNLFFLSHISKHYKTMSIEPTQCCVYPALGTHNTTLKAPLYLLLRSDIHLTLLKLVVKPNQNTQPDFVLKKQIYQQSYFVIAILSEPAQLIPDFWSESDIWHFSNASSSTTTHVFQPSFKNEINYLSLLYMNNAGKHIMTMV